MHIMEKSSSVSSPQHYHPHHPQHYENVEVEDKNDSYHHDDGSTNRVIPTTAATTTSSNRTIANDGGGKTTVMVIFTISIIMIFNSILLLYQYHLSTSLAMPSAPISTTSTKATTNATNIIETLQSSSILSMIPTLTSLTLPQHCSSMSMMMMMNDETMKSSSSSSPQHSHSPTHHHHHHQRRILHTTMETTMEQDHEEDANSTSMSITSESSSESSSYIFLWHVSIEMSMTILTNLIHAALFLVVGIIVHLRHDVIWMLYMYHTTLFWTIITLCSLVVYTQPILSLLLVDSTQSPLLFYIQYITIWLFGICTMIVWYRYRPTYQTTFQDAWNQHVTRNTTRNHYFTTATAIQILYYGCQFLQYGMIGYYCSTTLQYIIYNETYNSSINNDDCHHDRSLHDVSDHNDEMIMVSSWDDSNRTTTTTNNTMRISQTTTSSIDMNDFVMSYSEVAHLTFILSLLQLSIVYPHSNTCCIGTALVAGWKLLLNTISLSSLLQAISLSASWTIRSKLSLFYTIYDILIMVPILLATLYLYYSNNNVSSGPERNGKGCRTKFTRLDDTASTADPSSSSTTSMNDDVNFVSLGIESNHNDNVDDDDDDDDENIHVEDGIMKVVHSATTKQPMTEVDIHDSSSDHIATFACRTTFQIASSSSSSSSSFTKLQQQPIYTWRQQYGAKLLSYGSLILLIGMTLESIVLQSQSFLYVNHAKYDIYKWGLHLCVMFTFCTVMSMNVGVTYYEQYSRPILLLACPAGSLIAAYQCYNLLNGNVQMDIISIIVLLLFVIRCVCGIIQALGVYLLNTIQQQQYHCASTVSLTSSSNEDDNSNSSTSSNDDEELHIIDTGDGTTTVANFMCHHPVSLTQPQQSRQERLHELHNRINLLFYYLFIPIMIVYIAMSVGGLHYHRRHDSDNETNDMCLIEPNISPMIPSTMSMSSSCSDSSNMEGAKIDFMLMPNIPGLGLYFHFGLVLLLFIYDGIQRTVPTYTPSLFLATVSTYHLAIVLVTDVVVWDVLQTQFYTTVSLTNGEILQRLVQFVWSLISGYLAHSLHQFWIMRVTALHE